MPSSNSWLPTPLTSMPIEFSASIVGSSWKSAETRGLAPIRSPAPTVIVLRFVFRSASMCVARYAMPPAGTVFCVHPVCTPFVITGLQQPTWIVPGVFGARCPCRSLIASSWTRVSDFFAAATAGSTSSAAATQTRRRSVLGIRGT
jgi:hypothetical protein